MAIIGAALEGRFKNGEKGDCSHLVHEIYTKAGFPYPYANSIQLLGGINAFRQVQKPQPGDVAVWPGHAAIVVNPAQGSFFGATRSGLRVETFSSTYWKQRGEPRFLRYVKTQASSRTTQVAARTPLPTPPAVKKGVPPPPKDKKDNEVAKGQNVIGPAVPSEGVVADAAESVPSVPVTATDVPRIFPVNSPQPGAREVSATLDRAFSDAGKALSGQDLFLVSRSVIVFDRLEIKEVSLKGKQGWVDVKLIGPHPISPGTDAVPKRDITERWPLTQRDARAWELILPLKTVYLPRNVAVNVVSHQLAALAAMPGPVRAPKKKAELADLLHLFQQP